MGREQLKELRDVVRKRGGNLYTNQKLIKDTEIFKKSFTKKSKINPTEFRTPNLIYIEMKEEKYLIEPDGDGEWVLLDERGKIVMKRNTKKEMIQATAKMLR